MLIKAFCEATGLPRDTVRFYVKRGVVKPEIGSKPGNRYPVFDTAQVERAKLIKAAQRLGFSLNEISEYGKRHDAEDLGSDTKKAILGRQIAGLAQQERDLNKVRTYLMAKLSWVELVEVGAPPSFEEFEASSQPDRTVTPSVENPVVVIFDHRKGTLHAPSFRKSSGWDKERKHEGAEVPRRLKGVHFKAGR